MFRRLPHPLLHQLGLHWPSPLLLRALPRPVRQQQPHRALEGHSTLPRFLFFWEYKVGLDYDFTGCFPPGIGYSMLLIVIGIGLYYNVIIAWIIFYLIEVFISLPTGKLPWTTCGNRQIQNKRKNNKLYFESPVGTPTTAWTSTQSPQMVPDKPTTAAQLQRSSSQGKCSSCPLESNR